MTNKFKWIMVVCFTLLGVVWLVLRQKHYNNIQDQAQINHESNELHDYLACEYEPTVCAELYPNAAKKVDQAKKSSISNSQ